MITLLGWIDPDTGFLALIQNIMWEFLFPTTLFGYFLIHLKHPLFHSKRYGLLYVPFTISIVINLILGLDYSMHLYRLPFGEDHPVVDWFFTLEDSLSFLFNLFLILWSRKLIQSSKATPRIKKWLLSLNLIILLVIVIWFLREVESVFSENPFLSKLLWGSTSFVLWFVLYYGIFRLQIAIERKEIRETNDTIVDSSPTKKEKPTRQTSYVTKLLDILTQDRLYKNPLLSRLDLANQLNISEGYLSQMVNSELNKSVIQLVNELRIEEAKRMLTQTNYNKFSVEAIGLESGFKSKSAFYTSFKSATNIAPGTFRKQHQKTS